MRGCFVKTNVWGILRVLWSGIAILQILPPLWITGLLSSGSLTLCIWLKWRKIRARWRASYWLVFTQLLYYPTILVAAFGFSANLGPGPVRPNLIGESVVNVLIALSLLSGCYWIYRLTELRWLASSLVTLQEVLIFGAYSIAGMAVSGDWL